MIWFESLVSLIIKLRSKYGVTSVRYFAEIWYSEAFLGAYRRPKGGVIGKKSRMKQLERCFLQLDISNHENNNFSFL